MDINISSEIQFQTARSGGSGGQNVNKVESMVEGRWDVAASALVSNEQKQLIFEKLANKINSEGLLLVKSQVDRTQLVNKTNVIWKMNGLVNLAIKKKKIRIASKPSRAAKEKRLETKKRNAENKAQRGKISNNDY